jgi:hypothetical protein
MGPALPRRRHQEPFELFELAQNDRSSRREPPRLPKPGSWEPREWDPINIVRDYSKEKRRRRSSPRSYTTSQSIRSKSAQARGHSRVHRGGYRAQRSPRVYIPKPERQRPLTIAALEDKIVQGATATVLNAIYEEDFLGFATDSDLDAASMFDETHEPLLVYRVEELLDVGVEYPAHLLGPDPHH